MEHRTAKKGNMMRWADLMNNHDVRMTSGRAEKKRWRSNYNLDYQTMTIERRNHHNEAGITPLCHDNVDEMAGEVKRPVALTSATSRAHVYKSIQWTLKPLAIHTLKLSVAGNSLAISSRLWLLTTSLTPYHLIQIITGWTTFIPHDFYGAWPMASGELTKP